MPNFFIHVNQASSWFVLDLRADAARREPLGPA